MGDTSKPCSKVTFRRLPAAADGRAGAGGRFAIRLVRGPRPALHVDRVRGRRDGRLCESSRLTALRFCRRGARGATFGAKTTWGVHGDAAHTSGVARPAGALHSDRCNVFPRERQGQEDTPTQSTRALRTLDIEPNPREHAASEGRTETYLARLTDRSGCVEAACIAGTAAGAGAKPQGLNEVCTVPPTSASTFLLQNYGGLMKVRWIISCSRPPCGDDNLNILIYNENH